MGWPLPSSPGVGDDELTLTGLVDRQANVAPEVVALDDGQTMTYGELRDRAGGVAQALADLGVTHQQTVGVHIVRGVRHVCAALGVMRRGAVWVPLDPQLPPRRLEQLARIAGVHCLITDGSEPLDLDGVPRLPVLDAPPAGGELLPRPAGADVAYLLFTSGSTGEPKGVLVEHRSVTALLDAMDEIVPPPSPLVGATVSPIGFDVAIWELFAVLTRGGTLQILSPSATMDGQALTARLAAAGVTNAYLPPGLLSDVADALAVRPAALRRLLVGVEPIAQEVLGRLRSACPELEVVNGYGPTETTVCATAIRFERVEDPAARTPIGAALPGYTVEIVDPYLRRVPTGVIGEIVVGGPGVARGYIGDPVATARSFLPDPFSGTAGARIYRTGDLAWRDEQGTITYSGRRDAQVKVRGFRVEVQEVEMALSRISSVATAHIAVESHAGSRRLIAFVVATAKTSESELLGTLATMLPEHAVPSRLLIVDELPRRPNGKIDERTLRDLLRRRPDDLPAPEPAADGFESAMVEIWQSLLDVAPIGVDDDFFGLGGSSLSAAAMTRMAREITGRPVNVTDLLTGRTVRGIAARLRERVAADDIATTETRAAAPDTRAAAPGPMPASAGQAGMHLLAEVNPGHKGFYLPVALEIRCALDDAGARDAWRAVVRCHDALRRRLVWQDGVSVQLPIDAPEVLDWFTPTGPVAGPDAVAQAILDRSLASPPSLDRQPWRATAARLGPNQMVFVLVIHHAFFDGWSVPVLVHDLSRALAGEVLPLAPAAALVQDGRISPPSARVEIAEQAWRERLGERPSLLELPLDRGRFQHVSSAGRRLRRRLPAPSVAGLSRIAERTGATRFGAVLALLAIVARRYSGAEHVTLCTPAALRDVRGAESMVGYLVNLLALTVATRGDSTVDAVVAEAFAQLRQAQHDVAVPFEELARRTGTGNDRFLSSLARLVVVSDVPANTPFAVGETVLDTINVDPGTAKYELAVFITEHDSRVDVTWEYASDIFDASTIERLARSFETVAAAAGDPVTGAGPIDALELVDPRERHWRESLNHTRTDAPLDSGLTELLAEQVARYPDRPAVTAEGGALTHAELAEVSSRLAGALIAAGVRPGGAVLVGPGRSIDFVVSAVATIRAGAAYVPLDEGLPASRLAHICRATGAEVAITTQHLDLPDGVSILSPNSEGPPAAVRRRPGSPANVMFTSGSTGTPKAVTIPDRAIIRLVRAQQAIPIGPEDRFMFVSNPAFDAATLEIWGPLLNGGLLVVVGEQTVRDPRLLAAALAEHQITTGFFNVGVFEGLVETDAAALSSFRSLLVGGEAVPAPLIRRAAEVLAPNALVNGYGPTENTTFSCCYRLADLDRLAHVFPIGRAISNSTAYVVDDALRPAPVGVRGEIVVGGAGLAHGYLGDPRATALAFVPDPFSAEPGERLYRTGDHGRLRQDGQIEFLGRTDDLVKVRGFRIQLEEVQTLLGRCPDVSRAIAIAHEGEHGRQLLGFVESTASAQATRSAMVATAPRHLVPSQIVVLERFPLTPNGKVDRRALLAIRHSSGSHGSDGPRSGLQRALAEVWSELLGLDAPPIDVSFFELGGDSLRIIVLRDRIADQLGQQVPVAALVDSPTILSQAQMLSQAGDESVPEVRQEARERAGQRRDRTAAIRARRLGHGR